MSEKKDPQPKMKFMDHLTDEQYLKLKQFAREYMGLEKNYGKHGKKK